MTPSLGWGWPRSRRWVEVVVSSWFLEVVEEGVEGKEWSQCLHWGVGGRRP